MQDSDVRPLSVLEDTLNYLSNLLDSTEHPFEVVHDFIFDRMRAIRQDLSMQNIACSRAVSMYERMVCSLIRLSYPKELELELNGICVSRCMNHDMVASYHPTVPASQSSFLES